MHAQEKKFYNSIKKNVNIGEKTNENEYINRLLIVRLYAYFIVMYWTDQEWAKKKGQVHEYFVEVIYYYNWCISNSSEWNVIGMVCVWLFLEQRGTIWWYSEYFQLLAQVLTQTASNFYLDSSELIYKSLEIALSFLVRHRMTLFLVW